MIVAVRTLWQFFYSSCLPNNVLTPPGEGFQCNKSDHYESGCSGRQCCRYDYCNAGLHPPCKPATKLPSGQGEKMDKQADVVLHESKASFPREKKLAKNQYVTIFLLEFYLTHSCSFVLVYITRKSSYKICNCQSYPRNFLSNAFTGENNSLQSNSLYMSSFYFNSSEILRRHP